ncbi:ABC-2 family transporter protein [Allobranchiibius huperziae]|uniref:ABC-2 type transport system permease protein n=1 Tax=Allobranchiibius huperziae TaxID=1874116 RepID=A0A853DBY2_9MICO|nr:ABC-2 type transport system permease protein [Allobranchiibius huperziae]
MADTVTARTAPYRAVLASRIRAQRSYRLSFGVDLAASFLVSFIELAEVWVLFHAVQSLGGFDFRQILLVFGIADFCFSMADMVVGHCDDLDRYVRDGTLDVFYLRPQPLLLQLITSNIELRRLARAAVGLASIVIALSINDIRWSPAHVGLLAMTLIAGIAIFSAMFAWAAGIQFFVISGGELTNSFVYGGRYAATQVASVWTRPVKAAFGFFFPMAFTAFLPALLLLGKPGPSLLPAWLGWCTPLAAIWAWAGGLWLWRIGVRHYQGAGG